jgi:poly(hydroxyalkanoate) depolymerase family esterase
VEDIVMNEQQWAAMATATRLTREGRLGEATALIQRSLATPPAPEAPAAAWPGAAQAQPAHRHQAGAGAAALLDTPKPAAGPPRSPRLLGPGRPHKPLRALITTLPRRFSRGAARSADQAAAARPGGQWIQRSYTNAAGTRGYKLYVPTGYRGQAAALIVMLHGGTQSADDFAAGTRMNELAERDTFLVAYPEQDRAANHGGYWNWFQPADQVRGAGEPSLIAGITQEIMRTHSIDDGRVYVAGLSAGGAMTAVMAATYPDLYAAAGVHSGLPWGAAQDIPSAFAAMKQGAPSSTRPLDGVPLIVFHGDKDPIVAAINADQLAGQALQALTNARSRPERHTVTTTSGRVPHGHIYTRSSYHDDTGHTIVERWTIHQAGHAWSGGSPHGSYTDPQGPDASNEFVRFFRTHPKPTSSWGGRGR